MDNVESFVDFRHIMWFLAHHGADLLSQKVIERLPFLLAQFSLVAVGVSD